ncbi:ABC transporter substrate-binding protein [Azospirillum sp. YIM B02556]|uniref:ABC transporter substrate-binding protein n=1 Tax=Azospirillum endophyticum TaxID=2800326 RepID=A0ABS1FFP5_9PROT|nr:ABC transporter substrate-binding protein [Azospirillum endophyticum]MBK1842243.1 ABC transporter substrate-binding protein [Azospirillum endophyticum]
MMTLDRRQMLAATLGAFATMPLIARPGLAQDARALRVGLGAPNTSIDPHAANNVPNNAVNAHIFESLVVNDPASKPVPGLAASWRPIDDTRWEFKLHEGITFSDGSPLTLEDIQVSVQRATDLPSPSSFRNYTRTIKSVSSGDAPNSIIIETKAPDPILPNSLTRLRIIRAKFKDASSADFNSGKAAIGTGPYLLDSFTNGSQTLLKRNDAYWGGKAPWATVALRVLTDDGARVAGLLAGDLDLIDAVPTEGERLIKGKDGLHLVTGVSSRFVYMAMDQERDVTPFVTGHDGRPLTKNPFKDERVRQAIGMAINRDAIVERIMGGNALVATQFLPKGGFGTSDAIAGPTYDPAKAKALLAEAGYPNGFKLTLHGPNDRYVNDAKIVQAVAQMLARIGISSTVEVLPWSVYSGRVSAAEFSCMLGAWGVNTGETSNPLVALSVTYDKKAGTGSSNYGRYSNPRLDALVKEATSTLDDAKRASLLGEASEIVFNGHALIPLHHEGVSWGAKRSVEYTARADQYTMALAATPRA